MGYFWGRSRVQKLVWGLLAHGIEQLLFSMFLSILTFDFDLILVFFSFWGLYSAILGVGVGFDNCFHIVEQLSILTFIFDSIMGSFLTFGGPKRLFLGVGKSPNTVLGSLHIVEQLLFSMFSSFLSYIFELIFGSFRVFGA